ncbi:Thromboxane-A synthase [Sarcoptes scabiei]|uniref:Thromboxane-A synthase n=1 Tax=Sarcoptes scabiei TaxID=52283 RepID=A0A834RCT2_SARSC|nr:Thromboxane-A synthase [Sarcoptes scabiei]
MFSMTFYSIIIPAIVILLFQFILWIIHRHRFLQTFKRAGIKGPKPNFLTGNIKLFDTQFVFNSLDDWFEKYGDVCGYFKGDRAVLVIKDIDLIQQVFIDRFVEFPNRFKFMINLKPFDSSVLALRDLRWRQIRRIISPAFNSLKTLNANDIILRSTQQLMSLLKEPSANQSLYLMKENEKNRILIDITRMSKHFTLDIICRYAFDIQNEDFFDQNCPLFLGAEEIFSKSSDNFLIRLCLIVPWIKNMIEFICNRITLGRMIDQLVHYFNIKLAKIEQSEKTSTLLQFILKQYKLKNLKREEAIGNLLVILLAGYETTANAIAFTLFNLARNTEIQNYLRKSLDESTWNFEQSESQMKNEFLDRVIYESMRLYPPVTDFVIREPSDHISEFYELSFLNKQIKLDSHVAIQLPVWTLHHDPNLWPNPYKFDPSRDGLTCSPISTLSTDKHQRSRFFAFGLGQRSCIGGNLALAELRSVISALVLQYKINIIPEKNYEFDKNDMLKTMLIGELMKPCENIWLEFIPIEQ